MLEIGGQKYSNLQTCWLSFHPFSGFVSPLVCVCFFFPLRTLVLGHVYQMSLQVRVKTKSMSARSLAIHKQVSDSLNILYKASVQYSEEIALEFQMRTEERYQPTSSILTFMISTPPSTPSHSEGLRNICVTN